MIEKCHLCGADVDTSEDDPNGVQLAGGEWVCSEQCWNRVVLFETAATIGISAEDAAEGFKALANLAAPFDEKERSVQKTMRIAGAGA